MNKPNSIFIAKYNVETVMNTWNANYGLPYFAIMLNIEGSVSAQHGASSVADGGTACNMEGSCEYIE